MTTKIRKLRPKEMDAFNDLRDYLDGIQPELPPLSKSALRVFFQDHPVDELRVSEEGWV